MEARTIQITSGRNNNISIGVIPGHFATNHSHVNYYIDMTGIKRHYKMAKEAAHVFAADFADTPVDTIICLESTQVIGAFLAEHLSEGSAHSINAGNDINVITPELDADKRLIFRDNTQSMIWNKNVLLLISSASSGRTISACAECLSYYSGNLSGVAALFSAFDEIEGTELHAVFHKDDLPGYQSNPITACPMCAEGKKIDAIINDYGYSKI